MSFLCLLLGAAAAWAWLHPLAIPPENELMTDAARCHLSQIHPESTQGETDIDIRFNEQIATDVMGQTDGA